jgi:N6-adenosine-specific RNA methylase IME4/predicted transcriptional regulator
MKAEDAEEYTQALGQVVSGGWRQIALGERLGVPQALGLSVDEWVKQRLGGYVKLSIEERRQAAVELAAGGLKQRQIAKVLGVTQPTVFNDLQGDKKLSPSIGKPAQIQAQEKTSDKNLSPEPLDVLSNLAITNEMRAAAERDARREEREAEKEERRRGMRARTSETCEVGDLEELAASGQKFGTVYADPPWPYDNQVTRASTDNHYETKTVEWIAALPIAHLGASASHLHLWTTTSFLPTSFDIVKAWGFEFKSSFVWVKPQLGIGNYWRLAHEILILGVRGRSEFLDRAQRSWLEAERTKHSEKPEVIRQIIEKVSPGPRLELFARKITPGWYCWGNEIEKRKMKP